MYDQIAAVTLVAPTLMKTVELFVDVDINPNANYGVSVGAPQTWPGGEARERDGPDRSGLGFVHPALRGTSHRAASGWK